MKSWKGCRGFDTAVHCQITNAMPPYLIEDEARSPFPFSATSGASMYQHVVTEPNVANTSSGLGDEGLNFLTGSNDKAQCGDGMQGTASNTKASEQPSILRKTTCWEVLTLRLGDFVREQIALGITPSDDILQQEARKLLYGDYDSWNQTAADNPEWLALFKKAHGIISNSSRVASRIDNNDGQGDQAGDSSTQSPCIFNGLDQEDMMDLGLGDLSFEHQFGAT